MFDVNATLSLYSDVLCIVWWGGAYQVHLSEDTSRGVRLVWGAHRHMSANAQRHSKHHCSHVYANVSDMTISCTANRKSQKTPKKADNQPSAQQQDVVE